MMVRTLVTAPTAEPISVSEAKAQSRVTISDDDAIIGNFIIAAREYVENVTNRALVTQTWDLFLDSFPEVIEIPKSPLVSVTDITYVDTAGNSQTVASSVYTVDTDSDPGRIYLAYQKTWPTTRGIRHAITVRFVGGYGAASAVPDAIKQAMLLLVAHMYENREAVSHGSINNIPLGVSASLAPYRVAWF